jgi:hypothetical protein
VDYLFPLCDFFKPLLAYFARVLEELLYHTLIAYIGPRLVRLLQLGAGGCSLLFSPCKKGHDKRVRMLSFFGQVDLHIANLTRLWLFVSRVFSYLTILDSSAL